MNEKYYTTLGVSRNASAAELRSAFRKLAHRYHPDVSSEPNAAEKFIEISEAYRALMPGKKSFAVKTQTSVEYPNTFSAKRYKWPYTQRKGGERRACSRNRQGSKIDVHI